jgi:broad specificity phosphatase PhoE
MTEIVIVRHGETESNRLGLFRGRLDVPLNDAGRAQAERAAAALATEPISRVYSSPLSRALETARAIGSRHGIEPVVDEAFDNIDLGAWQGRQKVAVQKEEPELWRLWTTDPDSLAIPGGERLSDVRARAHARTLSLAREHDGHRIAIVSHRSVAKLLGGALLGLTAGYFWSLYLDNAGYSVFHYNDGKFTLVRWNEACHLDTRVVEQY